MCGVRQQGRVLDVFVLCGATYCCPIAGVARITLISSLPDVANMQGLPGGRTSRELLLEGVVQNFDVGEGCLEWLGLDDAVVFCRARKTNFQLTSRDDA